MKNQIKKKEEITNIRFRQRQLNNRTRYDGLVVLEDGIRLGFESVNFSW